MFDYKTTRVYYVLVGYIYSPILHDAPEKKNDMRVIVRILVYISRFLFISVNQQNSWKISVNYLKLD